jgi:NAD(P)-dependent dehydrogenase (short-subunit alcohol dehydrogenase family)
MTAIAGKVAFVTGAGSGIGRAVALALGREAAAVVAADIDGARAQAVAAEIREAGGQALAVACDVSDRASVRRARAEANGAFGRVLLLFANAGATSFDPIESVPDEIMDWIIEVNLMGVSHCAQVFLPTCSPRVTATSWQPRRWPASFPISSASMRTMPRRSSAWSACCSACSAK